MGGGGVVRSLNERTSRLFLERDDDAETSSETHRKPHGNARCTNYARKLAVTTEDHPICDQVTHPHLVVSLQGCSSSDPGAVGITGSPEQTSIPSGIYTGQVTRSWTPSVNGVRQQPTVETADYFEVVDANGLPLIQPEGETPVEGLHVTSEVGPGRGTLIVESVNASGNRLVITYTMSLVMRDDATNQEITMGGFGSWTYEYRPPDQLRFSGSAQLSSELINGTIASVTLSESAELTK